MFGRRLQSLREETELTQELIAKKLHISTSSYTLYESEKRKPHPDMLIKMARIYDASTDYILGITNVRNSNVKNIKLSDFEELQNLPREAIDEIYKFIIYIKNKYNKK